MFYCVFPREASFSLQENPVDRKVNKVIENTRILQDQAYVCLQLYKYYFNLMVISAIPMIEIELWEE